MTPLSICFLGTEHRRRRRSHLPRWHASPAASSPHPRQRPSSTPPSLSTRPSSSSGETLAYPMPRRPSRQARGALPSHGDTAGGLLLPLTFSPSPKGGKGMEGIRRQGEAAPRSAAAPAGRRPSRSSMEVRMWYRLEVRLTDLPIYVS